MSIYELILRFILGGSLVVTVSLIAKYEKGTFAGIASVFPVITIVSFYFMSKLVNKQMVLNAILSSIITLPSVLVFLIILYFSYKKIGISISLFYGVLGWFLTVIISILIKNYTNLG